MRSIVLGLSLAIALSCVAEAQQTNITTNSPQSTVVPRVIKFTGQLKDAAGAPLSGTVGVTFSLYRGQADKASLWIETQNVKLDPDGKYTVLLGSTKTDGVPAEMFASGEARWLGISVDGKEQPRILFASVPYALKAAEADTLAGHAVSDFVTSDKLTTTVQEQVKQATTSKKSDATTNVTDPATSFVDTNSTQVVAVTQNGTGAGVYAKATTGIALRGTSAGVAVYGSTTGTGSSPAVEGSSNSPTGPGVMGYNTATTGTPAALYGLATGPTGVGISSRSTSTTGSTRGIVASVASPTGIAALFSNTATSGDVLRAYGAGSSSPVFSVNTAGNVSAKGIFTGNGSGLTNVNATKLSGVSLSGLASLSAANSFSNQQYIKTAQTNYALQVYNTGTSGSLGAGVLAFANNLNGIGVYGEADSGQSSGVFGFTKSTKGAGVYGQFLQAATLSSCCSTIGGIAVWADTGSSNGTALVATANNSDAAQMFNNSQYATLYVENDSTVTSPYYPYVFYASGGNSSSAPGCGIDTHGNLYCTGSISGTVRGGGGQGFEMYAVQSTENWFEDAGSATLRNGVATVQLDSNFAAVANTGVTYQVFLTPNGDCKGLYVAVKGPNSFEVRELSGGTASISFDYRIVAKRKGTETVHMRPLSDERVPAVRSSAREATATREVRTALQPHN